MLAQLAPFRDRLLVLSGLDDRAGVPRAGEGGGDHARAAATFLTGVPAKKTEGPDISAGVSVDQIAAQSMASKTQLASLELAIETNEMVGACDAGYSCVYVNTLCWRDATTPLPMENDPRLVFERLFGDSDSTDQEQRIRRMREERSVLDSVTEEAAGLRRILGADERSKLSQYLEAVCDAERRIQTAESQNAQLPLVDRPAGTPGTFEEHAKLMFDLQVLAYQADITRVTSLLVGREQSGRSFPNIGIAEPHHSISHHRDDPELIAKKARIDAYHVQLLSYFLQKLDATPDGDGSLLDHSMILYGGGLGNPNLHEHSNLPVLLAGGGTGTLKSGRHIKYPDETPMTNLLVSLLDKVGVPMDKVGDSTGKLEGLSEI
jgi:hypothetical protein